MDEQELIRSVAKECGLSSNQANEVLNSLASNIKKALNNQGSVTLKELGTFTISIRSKIVESNPITGEAIRYSITHFPEFEPVQDMLPPAEERSSLE